MRIAPAQLAVLLLLASAAVRTAAAADLRDSATPGRLAGVTGEAHLLPLGSGEWQAPHLNSVIGAGDVLRAGSGSSLVLELSPEVTAVLGARSEVLLGRDAGRDVLTLRQGALVACVPVGSATVIAGSAEARIDGPALVRVDADGGMVRVTPRDGGAEVRGAHAWRRVRFGEQAVVDASGDVRVSSAERAEDDLDTQARNSCGSLGERGQLRRVIGASELAGRGRWIRSSGVECWVPDVHSGWRPFSDGCFRHDQRWGWAFVPHEPWGYVTHHHGSWVWLDGWGWAWVPGHEWHPHLVNFQVRGDHVTWCPRPPHVPVAENKAPVLSPAGIIVGSAPLREFDRAIVPARGWTPKNERAQDAPAPQAVLAELPPPRGARIGEAERRGEPTQRRSLAVGVAPGGHAGHQVGGMNVETPTGAAAPRSPGREQGTLDWRVPGRAEVPPSATMPVPEQGPSRRGAELDQPAPYPGALRPRLERASTLEANPGRRGRQPEPPAPPALDGPRPAMPAPAAPQPGRPERQASPPVVPEARRPDPPAPSRVELPRPVAPEPSRELQRVEPPRPAPAPPPRELQRVEPPRPPRPSTDDARRP